ncbi:hypothetical protein D3C72_2160700 [compost metagenome]
MPAIEHQHPVGLLHCRQTVGNDQGGTRTEETRKGLMQVVFSGRVQRRGGLVENHHLGLGQHHPRNRQTLALASGQAYARATDHSVQATRQCGNRAFELGNAQRLPASFIAAVAAHGQVGAHRVVEQ